MSYPCLMGQRRATRRPTTADYQLALRRAFMEWGLLERVAVDHDNVFYDNLSPAPFPTRLHLWLVALGVEVIFARKDHSPDQATIIQGLSPTQLMREASLLGHRPPFHLALPFSPEGWQVIPTL